MRYSASRPFSGSVPEALRVFEAALLPNGFRVVDSSSSRLQFKGHGMQSTKENPIRGATEVTIEAKAGALKLDASLGGVVALSLFVCLFPLALWAALTVPDMLKSTGDSWALTAKSLYGGGFWIIAGPAMSLWIRKRTTNALEDMLASAAVRAAQI